MSTSRNWQRWTPPAGPVRGRSGIDPDVAAVLRSGAPFTYAALAVAAHTNRGAANATPREMALAGSVFEVEVCGGQEVKPRLLRLITA
jgi:hypothetical protein